MILDGESISVNDNEANSVTGLFPIASEPDNNGKRTVFMPSLQDTASSSNSTHQLVRNLTLYDLDIEPDAPFDEYPYGIRVSTPGNVPDLTFGTGRLITDVKGGLHAYKDVDYNEFVAIAGLRRDNGGQLGNEESDYTKTYATGSLKFFVVSDDTLRAITCDNMPTFETSGTMPSFRIAVGDFDSDGVKSEIAVVIGSRDDEFYHLYIYKVTYTGGKFSASSIYTETTQFRRFKRPEKYASLFDEKDYGRFSDAAALATGDFDGDGNQELAMVCGDFYGESYGIGSPLHLMVRNRNNYVALMQVPPFHVDFIPEAWSSGDSHVTPKVTNVSHTGDTSVSYLHSTTTKSSEASKFSTKSMNMKFESGTNYADNMVAYESVLHIWRYPVLRPLLQNYRGAVDDNASMFMTFTVCDDLVERTGSPGDLYFATHEEGNLFSYPTRVGDIPGYDESKNQMTLGTPITKTADGLLSHTLGIAEGFSSRESKTVTGKVTASMAMSEKVGVESKIAKGSVEVNANVAVTTEVANCETFTKSYDEEEQIKFYAPANPFAGYAPFETGTQIFIDEAGVMTVGMFIRNIELKGGSVWSEYYNQKPDYALVLPGKFTRISVVDQGVPRLKWVGYNNKWGALALRGVRLQSTASSLYNDNKILRPGVEYKITVPVYNASFQPDVGTHRVPVRLSYQKQHDDSSRQQIGETVVELGGWKAATENNKATASFTWRVPEDFKAGAYQFCVELDPDNKTDEIHEVWGTNGDFGGNNLGYCDFAVWDGDDFGQVSSLMSPARTSNEDGTSRHVLAIRKKARSALLLNAASDADGVTIAADNDQTGMDSCSYINITNNDSETLLNLHFTLGVNETEEEDTPRFRVIKEWIVPAMFQGDSREFVLTYPYEELIAAAKEGKLEFRVSNPNAKISYTYSKADFDVEEDEKKDDNKEDDSGNKESHGTPPVKAEFRAISDKARENFATPAVRTTIENKVKELLGNRAVDYPYYSELPAGAVSSQAAKKVTADQLASVITTGRKSFDISPLTFPTVSVDKPGVYPLGAVPTTNLAQGMELYVYMLVVDEAEGTVRLVGTDFFDMKIAADSTEGAFFADDAENVITRIPGGLDVNIWTPLSAGVEYTAVVALAEDDSDVGVGSSGGCGVGVAGAGILFALVMLMTFRRTTR